MKGVAPDLVLPSLNNYAEVGEVSLENPLPWDEIPSAKYEKLNLIQPILPELRKRSTGRMAADNDFGYLLEDIETYKKYLADKSVSLNEAARLKEMKENEEKITARKKERKTRQEPEEKVYELTLKQVDLPGLQPTAKTPDESGGDAKKDNTNSDDDEDAAPEDKVPAVDVTMKETKRVLLDLVALSSKSPALVVHD